MKKTEEFGLFVLCGSVEAERDQGVGGPPKLLSKILHE